MAHVEDRWMRKKRDQNGDIIFDAGGKPVMEHDPDRYGKGKRWRVRYIAPDGKERNKSFAKKIDAENFKGTVAADVLRGTYIDPAAGKITFQALAEKVMAARTLNASSREAVERRLRRHVYPVIGSEWIGCLARRPSMIQNLVRAMEAAGLATHTIEATMAHVQLVFSVAIEDEMIQKNPCNSRTVVLPKRERANFVPWTGAQAAAFREALPEYYKAIVDVGKGVGLRKAEIHGLSPDDIRKAEGEVIVVRQVKVVGGTLVFAPPKGGKGRSVPLAGMVARSLASHEERFPAIAITLPWKTPEGPPMTVRLYFTTSQGTVIGPSGFAAVWRTALTRAGIVPLGPGERWGRRYRMHGVHMLRHLFASVLLSAGESPKAVAEWMGHSDGGALLLRTYAHLLPSSAVRMRSVIDAALTAHGRPRARRVLHFTR